MRKINLTLVVLVVLFLIANIAQFFFWRNSNTKTVEKYTSELAELELQLATYGEKVTVYTVTTAAKAGDEVTAEMLEPVTSYDSVTTDQFIYDTSAIVGRYFKIAVNPGTPLLNNMFMDEELDDTVRERDLSLNYHTAGLDVGDYIDIRITLPYGDDYIAISHKRVYGITDNTVKLYLTEYEWNIYQGMFVDYCLNEEYGCVIYADKYIEPGLQQEAVKFYAVPSNIATLLQKNPNIVDKVEAASLNEWRNQLEELLVLFRDNEDTVDADGGRLSGGRSTYTENVTEADSTIREKREEDAQNAASDDSSSDSSVGDDFWTDDATSSDTSSTTDDTAGTESTDDTAEGGTQ